MARIAEIASLQIDSGSEPGELARAAIALHHAYGAVEALLVRVARELGEAEPSGKEWHQAVLHSMGLNVEGVRPAILRPESVRLLRRLLAFRHFFRHAYTVMLDWEQLATLRRESIELRSWLEGDLGALDDFLRELAEQTRA